MQRPDEQKRRDILSAAGRLFASRAFHEVRLEDVAAEAKVGKGTIYIYFKSKEDLYVHIGRDEFKMLVQSVKQLVAREGKRPADQTLQQIVRQVATFGLRNPLIFHLARTSEASPIDDDTKANRKQLGELIATVIRRGNARGEFADPHPQWTAQFIPAAVRACILYGAGKLTVDQLSQHVMRIVVGGLKATRSRKREAVAT